jgi:O-antigen ligase
LSALATKPEPAPPVKAERPRLSNSMLLAGTGAVLLAAPLAFGAVEPWSIFALETCGVLLLIAWGYKQWLTAEPKITNNVLYRPMAAFLVLAFVQWATGTTAYRHVTYTHLLLYATYFMLTLVATQSLRRASHFDWTAKVASYYGAAVAAFAVLQGIAPNGKLYWIWASSQGGAIYGPYVNRNHYAGLMEMLIPFPLVLAVSHFTDGNRRIAFTAIAALMAGSIFLSGSRGGMVAFCAQMVVLTVLLVRSKHGSWRKPLMLGAFLVLVIGFLVWVGGNEVTRRLVSIHSEARTEISGGLRLTIDRDCLRMISKRPFLGWGLGSFPIAYPQFRSFYTTFFVNQAHNDYLQMVVEMGIAGLAVAIWFFVLMFRQAASKLKNWGETTTGALTVAALLGCVGILVHSLVDFNLQIPANAALFFVLCGIAAAQPLQESHRRRVIRNRNLIAEVQPVNTVL